MQRLALRRGTVVAVDGPQITVAVDGEERPAIAYEELTGPNEVGDDVVVNVAARELKLGSGGFDIVHVNLTRGLAGTGIADAHVMKLNYTPLQHAVEPVEAAELELPVEKPVAVCSLHAQVPCVAWGARDRGRVGYVQTGGGALPGSHSRVVADLLERGLLAGHVCASPAFGGQHDAISTIGGIHAGLAELGWDAAIVGPGPGILGSATALGHGGMQALDSAHAALALGCRTILVPRMSSGDRRARHWGVSHHTRTVLDLLLKPVVLAKPGDEDLPGYLASGLPATTMGRTADEDPVFFMAALAGGRVLAASIG
ncbi:MAG TPA: DUF3866 family protein [Thermoleophilaceae bacterium]|nr:DUF3866 family protein [Thermoleophilaceae bacterium]